MQAKGLFDKSQLSLHDLHRQEFKAKDMYKIIFGLLFPLLVTAQTSIKRLEEYSIFASPGTYFQDVDAELDKYTGTWIFSSGNIVFTIKLQKETMVQADDIFKDMLVGEYSYTVNNVIVVNTLGLLDSDSANPLMRNIQGNRFHPDDIYPACNDCEIPDKRLKLTFIDPERDYLKSTRLFLQYLPNTSPQQIKVIIAATSGSFLPDENSPTKTRVPYGTYVMTKI